MYRLCDHLGMVIWSFERGRERLVIIALRGKGSQSREVKLRARVIVTENLLHVSIFFIRNEIEGFWSSALCADLAGSADIVAVFAWTRH